MSPKGRTILVTGTTVHHPPVAGTRRTSPADRPVGDVTDEPYRSQAFAAAATGSVLVSDGGDTL